VDVYILKCSPDIRVKLKQMRDAVKEAAPGAIKTMSYFHIPGYSYPGYDYNGMFACFDFHQSGFNFRLRPPAIQNHKKELQGYASTKSLVRFPLGEKIPPALGEKVGERNCENHEKKSKKSVSKTHK
jgi:uncharacterized protein YdhG (YjbR/CyaY superfamily)